MYSGFRGKQVAPQDVLSTVSSSSSSTSISRSISKVVRAVSGVVAAVLDPVPISSSVRKWRSLSTGWGGQFQFWFRSTSSGHVKSFHEILITVPDSVSYWGSYFRYRKSCVCVHLRACVCALGSAGAVAGCRCCAAPLGAWAGAAAVCAWGPQGAAAVRAWVPLGRRYLAAAECLCSVLLVLPEESVCYLGSMRGWRKFLVGGDPVQIQFQFSFQLLWRCFCFGGGVGEDPVPDPLPDPIPIVISMLSNSF